MDPADTPAPGTLKRRLPELLLEAFFVVFAVLVALAVDEYWEGREEEELAEIAQENVAAEVQANAAELGEATAANRMLYANLAEALSQMDAGGDPTLSDIQFEVSLLGADAWEAARVTRAVHFMEFERVSRISTMYGVQSLFLERQSEVVDVIANIGTGEVPIEQSFRRLHRALGVALSLECQLAWEYDRVERELSRDAAPEDAASPCD